MAAGAVIPELLVETARVLAQVDVVKHRGFRCGEAIGAPRAGIAQGGEFLEGADAAMGTWNRHEVSRTSVQVWLGAHALLVDQPACGEAIEPVGGRKRVRF